MKRLTILVVLFSAFVFASCDKIGAILEAVVEVITVNKEGSPLCGYYDPVLGYEDEFEEDDERGFTVYDLNNAGTFDIISTDRVTEGSPAQVLWGMKVGECYTTYPRSRFPLFGFTSPKEPNVGIMCFGDMTTWAYKVQDNGDLKIWNDPQDDDCRYPDLVEAVDFIEDIIKNDKCGAARSVFILKTIPEVYPYRDLTTENNAALCGRLVNGDDFISYFPIPPYAGNFAGSNFKLYFGNADHDVTVSLTANTSLYGKDVDLGKVANNGIEMYIDVYEKTGFVNTFHYKNGVVDTPAEFSMENMILNVSFKETEPGYGEISLDLHEKLEGEDLIEPSYGYFDIHLDKYRIVQQIN